MPSACAFDCNTPHRQKEFAAGATHRRSASDPGTRGAGADQTFRTTILPRRSRRDRSVADTHRPHPRREDVSIGTVVVAHQVGRRRGPGEGLGDLSGQPLGRRMSRHLEPQQLSPAVTQNQERKQAIKGQRRHNAQIDRGDRLRVVSKKRLPGLRRRCSNSHYVFRDRRLGHLEPQASGARHGFATRPTAGFPCSSVGSDHAGRDQSSAALPAYAISSARTALKPARCQRRTVSG